MTDRPQYVYVTYIESTPSACGRRSPTPTSTAEYWGHANVSDWQEGSTWEHRRTDGSGIADVVGTVVESPPPRRLVTTRGQPAGTRRRRARPSRSSATATSCA